jgi:hypothetical protein
MRTKADHYVSPGPKRAWLAADGHSPTTVDCTKRYCNAAAHRPEELARSQHVGVLTSVDNAGVPIQIGSPRFAPEASSPGPGSAKFDTQELKHA